MTDTLTCTCGHTIVRHDDKPGETARGEEFGREIQAHAEAHALIKLFASM